MIISASRRTDIPAFYAPWFMNRVRAGFVNTPNPFNPQSVSRFSLRPEDVDAFVFWSRFPKPLLPHLPELEAAGYGFVFIITLTALPRDLEPRRPRVNAVLRLFHHLAERIGPERVLWRYDPVFISPKTNHDFHVRTFTRLAKALEGAVNCCKISLMRVFRKTRSRLAPLFAEGFRPITAEEANLCVITPLIRDLADIARAHGVGLESCAEELDLRSAGVARGACIDPQRLRRALRVHIAPARDKSQRPFCRCALSRDIGMYESCRFGCSYCYATGSFARAREHHRMHRPEGESLFGGGTAAPVAKKKGDQLTLWDT